MDYVLAASDLEWKDDGVFVPPATECLLYPTHGDGTPCTADEFTGFWIPVPGAKHLDPQKVADNSDGVWEARLWEEDDGWHVSGPYFFEFAKRADNDE